VLDFCSQQISGVLDDPGERRGFGRSVDPLKLARQSMEIHLSLLAILAKQSDGVPDDLDERVGFGRSADPLKVTRELMDVHLSSGDAHKAAERPR